jgi:hypothetical protein
MTVLILPTKPNVEAAWERYVAMLHELQSDPGLITDRNHAESIVQAEREWSDIFRRWSKKPSEPKAMIRQ